MVSRKLELGGHRDAFERHVRPKKTNITYEVWRGGTPADMDQLGFPFAIPSTAILDSSGKVVDRFTGHIAASRLTNIDRLLEMPSKRP